MGNGKGEEKKEAEEERGRKRREMGKRRMRR